MNWHCDYRKIVLYETIVINTLSLGTSEHHILNSITELQITFLPHGNWTCEMQEIPIHSFVKTKIYMSNSACYLKIGNALNNKEYYSASHRISFLSVCISYHVKIFHRKQIKRRMRLANNAPSVDPVFEFLKPFYRSLLPGKHLQLLQDDRQRC